MGRGREEAAHRAPAMPLRDQLHSHFIPLSPVMFVRLCAWRGKSEAETEERDCASCCLDLTRMIDHGGGTMDRTTSKEAKIKQIAKCNQQR